ncbi:MAG TPA: sigma-70 family RNA polymerase sigma factor [Jiangellaceae bacterium]
MLAAARSGAPWAFERLYAELSPQVANYLTLRGVTERDDVTSEVFLAVFQRLATFTGSEAKFRSWVFAIAHNKAADVHRRETRRPWAEAGPDAVLERPGGNVEDEAMSSLATQRVCRLLDTLPDLQREVLLLRIVADLTVEQVAAALGKSSGAIKQHQRRALIQLREKLEREGVTL